MYRFFSGCFVFPSISCKTWVRWKDASSAVALLNTGAYDAEGLGQMHFAPTRCSIAKRVKALFVLAGFEPQQNCPGR